MMISIDENAHAWYIREVWLLRNLVVTLTAERDEARAQVAALEQELEAEEGHRKGLEKAYGNLSKAYELLKNTSG